MVILLINNDANGEINGANIGKIINTKTQWLLAACLIIRCCTDPDWPV